MSDPEIRERLIAAQRRFDAAHAAVVAASARPGRVGDWPAEQRAELEELRRVEREAVVELYRLRDGTEFAPWAEQRRLWDAAAGQG